MDIDALTLYALAAELGVKLNGSRLQKIFQPGKNEYVFRFRTPGENFFLFASFDPDYPRVYPIPAKPGPSVPPSGFCMMLRKHVEGGKVTAIEPSLNDRIFTTRLTAPDEEGGWVEKSLVFEFTGKNPNVILLDAGNRYIGVLNRNDPHREFTTGQPYESPPPPPGVSPFTIDKEGFMKALEPGDDSGVSLKKKLGRALAIVDNGVIREMARRCGVPAKSPLSELTGADMDALWNEFEPYFSSVGSGELVPYLYYSPGEDTEESRPQIYSIGLFGAYEDMNPVESQTVCKMLSEFYSGRLADAKMEERKSRALNAVKKRIKKVKVRIKKQEKDFEGASRAGVLKKRGGLILANLHNIEKGQKSVQLEDYFKNPPETVTVKLKPELSPSENAQDYFNRYKKAQRGQAVIKERLAMSRDELESLREAKSELEQADTGEDIDSALRGLEVEIFQGKGLKRKKKDQKSGPRIYELGNGYVALVGRNSKQNEEIAIRKAKKDDVWLHARQIPGSHVVLRIQKPSNPVPDAVLYKAAQLAAYFSQAKESPKAPVDYTRIKNVRKVKGEKAGKVFYTNEKTLFVKPSDYPEMRKD